MKASFARASLAAGCRATTLLGLAEWRIRGQLTILCYHRILPASDKEAYFRPDLVVTPEAFRRHCLALRRHYEVHPLRRAVHMFQKHGRIRRPMAAVTFDDGYGDNLRYAAPVLSEAGIKATFFVITDLIGRQQAPWYDRLGRAVLALGRQARGTVVSEAFAEAESPGDSDVCRANGASPKGVIGRAKMLTSARRRQLVDRLAAQAGTDAQFSPDDRIMNEGQLRILADSGHEIGSHSATHEILPRLDDESLDAEVVQSRRILQAKLGRPVRSFCYPNGDVDERVAAVVRKAGYDCAVTVECGTNARPQDQYRLRRWFVHEERLAGCCGRTSETLLRMEFSGLADCVFGRRLRRRLVSRR